MDAIWPDPATNIDVAAGVAEEARTREGRTPWVTMLMITSLDGAAALDGESGGLGAPADKAVFSAMRSITDVIVVGAGTARAEDYGPVPERSDAVVSARVARGQNPRPTLAVVTRSLDLSPEDRLFSDPDAPPVIYTVEGAPASQRQALAGSAEFVIAGTDRVEPAQVVANLATRGHRHILLEGGPRLNGDFLAAGLVDELHLSVAPVAVGGDAPRIITGALTSPAQGFALSRIWAGDGLLFLRYLRPSR